jgi:hypothetical protein
MQHINYFFPYNKNTENHEDHLTRAFLVLLDYSPILLTNFYTYIQSKVGELIEPVFNVDFSKIEIQTQKRSLPETNKYLSVLITNEPTIINQKIIPVDRNPIYDGVIKIGESLTIFIETKPNKNNVWENQLCPSKSDISEYSELIEIPAILEWKEIINILHNIQDIQGISFQEKRLINDFFELINSNFSFLNPYDKLSKCTDKFLIEKRIQNILNAIALKPDLVQYHTNWSYYIDLKYSEIRKIALKLNYENNDDWSLSIICDFGATVGQARAFYRKVNNYNKIQKYLNNNWIVFPNLHLSFKNQNLLWFNSPVNSIQNYFQYWNTTQNDIKQFRKTDIPEYLSNLKNKGIIEFEVIDIERLNEKVMQKGYTTTNLCPSIQFRYVFPKKYCIENDNGNILVNQIKSKMIEILSILDYPTDDFIKQ